MIYEHKMGDKDYFGSRPLRVEGAMLIATGSPPLRPMLNLSFLGIGLWRLRSASDDPVAPEDVLVKLFDI